MNINHKEVSSMFTADLGFFFLSQAVSQTMIRFKKYVILCSIIIANSQFDKIQGYSFTAYLHFTTDLILYCTTAYNERHDGFHHSIFILSCIMTLTIMQQKLSFVLYCVAALTESKHNTMEKLPRVHKIIILP
jgi:hypothetical protein